MCFQDFRFEAVISFRIVLSAFGLVILAPQLTMQSLRAFVSDAHQKGLDDCWLLDFKVADPYLEERLMLIRRQVIAALGLHAALSSMGCDPPDTIDLLPLVNKALEMETLSPKHVGILRALNKQANAAKHALAFRSHL